LLTALDHRAATYEKMAQLQAALRDSKQMIELKPELAKVPAHTYSIFQDAKQRLRVTFDVGKFCNSKGRKNLL
jgi:F-box/TPR repeat protein Pof3